MIAVADAGTREKHDPDSTEVELALLERETRGSFQVVREIGRGGMGVVFLARDVRLHRHVAIKVLLHDLAGDAEQRERFRREARITARLGGEGIVAIHDIGESGDLAYFVMDYVDGRSLAHSVASVRTGERLGVERVRNILVDLATTLHRAHAQGIVHRDLKPENVLLDRATGRAVLTDFGVAISRNVDPAPNTVERAYGTPHFMSPEQAAGQLDLDGRSDIYSLGVLGYLLLTGELPFDADQAAAIASKHVAEAPVPVQSRIPTVPKHMAAAIDVCLRKDPAKRWECGNELAAALSGQISNRLSPTSMVTSLVASGIAVFDWLTLARR